MAKLVTTLGTTLLVAGAATTTTPASDTSERMLRQAMGYSQRGMHALEKGNAARAAEDFQRALKEVPELPDAHAGLGHVAMQQRRFEDALAAYRRAQQAYRNFAAQRVDLAQDRYSRSMDRIQYLQDEKGKLDREQRQAQVQGGPLGTGSGPSEGTLQREKLAYEREIAQLQTQTQVIPALEGDVSDPPAAYDFYEANALFNLKRNDEAITAWKRAVEKDPNYAVAFNNLAVAYWTVGRLDDAQTSLARAESLGFKINPSFRADLQKSIAGKK
ncbi:MAG TPA: tetratricopeptide repeat protein [Candidatus Bathyarchaeia archaeon]|nr:tetratricopeptide repeat protein [Candidatus Bathyarchaeia archaeon]